MLVGIKEERFDLAHLLDELKIAKDVAHSGFVSDEDLNVIYNAAEAFVMPSAYETSSLPAMEALQLLCEAV